MARVSRTIPRPLALLCLGVGALQLLLPPSTHAFMPPLSRPPPAQARVGRASVLAAAAAAAGGGGHHELQSTLGAGMSVDEALTMLQSLGDPTVADYNRALAACAREGNHEPGCWLIDEMVEMGLEPDRTSFALAIQSCGPGGMVEEARHLLSCMKDAEYELDVAVYGSVALACERAKNWRQLMWTFDEMQLRDLVPTLDSYKSAIKGCTQEGEWEMALSLVLEADRRGLSADRESFELAMDAVTGAKQPARARDLLKAMREANHAPAQAMLAAVVALCKEVGEDALAEEISRDFGLL